MSSPVEKHHISDDLRNTISKRYKRITQAVNRAFWNSESETAHSIYVGSYGRGTAIDTSDIDVLVELPSYEYDHFTSQGESHSPSFETYEKYLLRRYHEISNNGSYKVRLVAPGSGKEVDASGSWETLGKVLNYMA